MCVSRIFMCFLCLWLFFLFVFVLFCLVIVVVPCLSNDTDKESCGFGWMGMLKRYKSNWGRRNHDENILYEKINFQKNFKL